MTEFGLLAAILGIFVFFAAGLTQGLTGFGFALVAVPILGLVASPQLVVPAVIIGGTASNFILLLHVRRWVRLGQIWPLMLAGSVAAPFGAHLLDILSADVSTDSSSEWAVLTFTVNLHSRFSEKDSQRESSQWSRWDSPVVFWGEASPRRARP